MRREREGGLLRMGSFQHTAQVTNPDGHRIIKSRGFFCLFVFVVFTNGCYLFHCSCSGLLSLCPALSLFWRRIGSNAGMGPGTEASTAFPSQSAWRADLPLPALSIVCTGLLDMGGGGKGWRGFSSSSATSSHAVTLPSPARVFVEIKWQF